MEYVGGEEMRKIILVIISVAASSIIVSASTMAGTINVPSASYPTIQSVIDAAAPGDTVQMAAGTYIENITQKSGVIVQGAGALVTTIRGTVSGSVLTAYDLRTSAKIDGFTITGGTGPEGGGIFILFILLVLHLPPPITISNNIITGNTADTGGGIYCDDSGSGYPLHPTITNSIIWGNGVDLNSCCTLIVTYSCVGNPILG